MIPTAPFAILSRCSPLDALEAEQRAVSASLIALEQRRQDMLLRPGCDGLIADIDRRIERQGRALDQIAEREADMLRWHIHQL